MDKVGMAFDEKKRRRDAIDLIAKKVARLQCAYMPEAAPEGDDYFSQK